MKQRITTLAALICMGILCNVQAQEPLDLARIEQLKTQLVQRFKQADTNGDGRLSRDEARNGMPRVYQHFDEIDASKQGFVTVEEIESFVAAKAAANAPLH